MLVALHGQHRAGDADFAQIGRVLKWAQLGVAHLQRLHADGFGAVVGHQLELGEAELVQRQRQVVRLGRARAVCCATRLPICLGVEAELAMHGGRQVGAQVRGQHGEGQVIEPNGGVGLAGHHSAFQAQACRGGWLAGCCQRHPGFGRCRGGCFAGCLCRRLGWCFGFGGLRAFGHRLCGSTTAQLGSGVERHSLCRFGGQGPMQLLCVDLQLAQRQAGWLLIGVWGDGVCPVHAAARHFELGHAQCPTIFVLACVGRFLDAFLCFSALID